MSGNRERVSRRRAIALLAGLPLLAACDRAGPDQARQGQPWRIAIDLWAGYYPLLLAQDLGLLREARVAVEVHLPQDTRQMLSDFVAGSYDAVCASLGDMILLTRESEALHMVMVADESVGGDALLANASLSGAATLRGRRVGLSLGGFGELLVLRFLARHGLGLGDVQLFNVDASEVPGRLAEGLIDIGHSWEPYVSSALRRGQLAVFSSADTPGLIQDGLIVHRAQSQARGAELRRLIAAWFEAQDWWRNNPAAARERLMTRLAGRTEDISLAGMRLLGRADNRLRFGQGATEHGLQHIALEYVEHFVARGLLPRRPRAEALFDGSFIG